MRPPRRVTQGRLALLTVSVLAPSLLALAACSYGNPPVPPAVQSATATPSATKITATTPQHASPLTGLDVKTAANVALRVVAVPVAIGPGLPAPSAAIGDAEVAYQSFGPGATSRVVAMYQAAPGGVVGPVAVTQPTDGRLLPPVRGLLATTGGTAKFVRNLAKSGVVRLDPAHQPTVFRSAGGAVYADVRAARRYAGIRQPPTLWSFASGEQPLVTVGDRPASQLTVAVPGQAPVVWRLASTRAFWTTSVGGTPVSVKSVVVMMTPYKTALDHFPKGHLFNVPKVFGRGNAWVVSGGQSSTGTYDHPGPASVANLVDRAGFPMLLTPGRVWVMLVPPGTKVTKR